VKGEGEEGTARWKQGGSRGQMLRFAQHDNLEAPASTLSLSTADARRRWKEGGSRGQMLRFAQHDNPEAPASTLSLSTADARRR